MEDASFARPEPHRSVEMENSSPKDKSARGDTSKPQNPSRKDKSMSATRGRPAPVSVAPILTQGGPNSPRRPPPSERLPDSPNARVSLESPQVSASPTKSAHLRSQSMMDSPRRINRMSMSFPVLPPNSGRSRPTSWANSPVLSPTEPSPPTEGSFLTQLASQERRVLELKEALRQAEAELGRLKKHWASHEAHKKRSDVRRVQALQPITTNISSMETSEDDADGSSQWMQKEMERRKALLSGIKTSNRTVFSGSKHTRTLSLLSPEKGSFSQPFPQPADVSKPEENPYHSPTHTKATSDAFDPLVALAQSGGEGGPSKDVLLRTGKQMATDIRDGLLTFFEDIRQATIGEEATMTPQPATKSLKRSNTTGTNTTRSSRAGKSSTANTARRDPRQDALVDIGGSFWREHGVETPTSKPIVKTKKQALHRKTASPIPNHDDTEPWDNWDTPIKTPQTRPQEASSDTSEEGGSHADSASDGVGTPLTDEHSRPTPRTSTSSSSKRNSIPWPDLEKLSPGNLKRTASHLMREWEKSLTPSPSELDASVESPFSPSGKTSKSD